MCFTNMCICFSTDLQHTCNTLAHLLSLFPSFIFIFSTYSTFLPTLSILHFSHSLFPPFPSILYDLFSHTLYIHPFSSGVLHFSAEKSKGGWGCAVGGREEGCADWKGLCVCVSLLCFALLGSTLGLPACLHCCCFLCGLPANFMIYSAKGRGARPPVTTERALHVGLMISPQKCLLWLGPLFQGHEEREREREKERHPALTAHIHLLNDSCSYLGRLPKIDINRKQEKTITTLYTYVGSNLCIFVADGMDLSLHTQCSLSHCSSSLFLLFFFQEHVSGRVTEIGRVRWCN